MCGWICKACQSYREMVLKNSLGIRWKPIVYQEFHALKRDNFAIRTEKKKCFDKNIKSTLASAKSSWR